MVRHGKFPDKDALQKILNPDDYESDFSINPKYDSSLKPSKLTLVDSAGEIIEAKKWLVEVEK